MSEIPAGNIHYCGNKTILKEMKCTKLNTNGNFINIINTGSLQTSCTFLTFQIFLIQQISINIIHR